MINEANTERDPSVSLSLSLSLSISLSPHIFEILIPIRFIDIAFKNLYSIAIRSWYEDGASIFVCLYDSLFLWYDCFYDSF